MFQSVASSTFYLGHILYGWTTMSEILFLNTFVKLDPYSGFSIYIFAVFNILILQVNPKSKDIFKINNSIPIFYFGYN